MKKIRTDGNSILSEIQNFFGYIKNTPFENHTYLVGGVVRNLFFKDSNLKNSDIDIVVDFPNGGIELATYMGKIIGRSPVIYENFGTAALKVNKDWTFEFVHTRKETYKGKSRKPETFFGTLEEDIYRRDFTINSLLFDFSTNEIIDITEKGIDDIQNRILRTTNDPNIIFGEDPFRILRAFRFAGRFHLMIEEETLNGIRKDSHKLANISIERINDEFKKILLIDDVDNILRLMADNNVLDHIIPELLSLRSLKQNPKFHHQDAFEHTLNVVKQTTPTIINRLSALFHDIGKAPTAVLKEGCDYYSFHGHEVIGSEMTKIILERLLFPNYINETITNLVLHHMFCLDKTKPSEHETRKLLHNLNCDIDDLIELIEADRIRSHYPHTTNGVIETEEMLFQFKRQIEEIRIKDQNLKTPLPINGNDIMNYFHLNPCKQVGELLSMAQEYIFENPNTTKDEILKWLYDRFNEKHLPDMFDHMKTLKDQYLNQ